MREEQRKRVREVREEQRKRVREVRSELVDQCKKRLLLEQVTVSQTVITQMVPVLITQMVPVLPWIPMGVYQRRTTKMLNSIRNLSHMQTPTWTTAITTSSHSHGGNMLSHPPPQPPSTSQSQG